MLTLTRRAFVGATIAALAAPGFADSAAETIPGFDDALAAGAPVLVHVTATWCEICQAQKPIVAALLKTPDFAKIKMFEVDFDTRKEVLRSYNVQSQSTMILYKAGKEIDRQVGQTDPAVIEAFLREAL